MPKNPELNNRRDYLLRYCQEFDHHLIEEEVQLLCFYERFNKLEDDIKNLPTFITFLGQFKTWPLQQNRWTYGRFENLQ